MLGEREKWRRKKFPPPPPSYVERSKCRNGNFFVVREREGERERERGRERLPLFLSLFENNCH